MQKVSNEFDEHVIDELSFIKEQCVGIKEVNARQVALTAFSSIIVLEKYGLTSSSSPCGDVVMRVSLSLKVFAGDFEERRGKWLANPQVLWPPPLCATEAGR